MLSNVIETNPAGMASGITALKAIFHCDILIPVAVYKYIHVILVIIVGMNCLIVL